MNPQAKQVCANLIADPRFTDFKLAILEESKAWAFRDSAESHGCFMGLMRAFDLITDGAKGEKPAKKQKDAPFSTNESDDPDLRGDPDN